MATVKLGDDELIITAFSTYKALLVIELLGEISEKVPDILQRRADFRREYEEKNSIWLTRAQARMRFPDDTAGVSDADWEKSDNRIPMRLSPSFSEEIAAIFPLIARVARKQTQTLIALVATPNRDLETWDDNDQVDEKLAEHAKRIAHRATPGQTLELAVCAAEAIEGEVTAAMAELGDRTGNALRLVGLKPKKPLRAVEDDRPGQEGRSPEKPSSSSTSPASSDGPGETSSTEPAGSSPSSSATA